MHCVVFVAVTISFGQSSYFASETQGFMNVTLISSLPVDVPYNIVVIMLQSTPVSAAGDNIRYLSKTHCVITIYCSYQLNVYQWLLMLQNEHTYIIAYVCIFILLNIL